MDLAQFCSTSRVVIVAGKGGTGKTTVAATLAVTAARTGASVLVVDVAGKSGLAPLFGQAILSYDGTPLGSGIEGRLLSPDEALVEYLERRGLRRVARRLARSGTLDVVATAVPGLPDLLVLAKLRQLEQQGTADLIVVDAPAAGHAVTFLLSAQGILDAVGAGPVHHQAAEVAAMLADPARCRVLLVTIAEETPVNELVETAFLLEDRVSLKIGPVVVNRRVAGTPLAADGLEGWSEAEARADAARIGAELEPGVAAAFAEVARFGRHRAAHEQAQVERLAARLPLPQLDLPALPGEIIPAALDTLADALQVGVAALPVPRAR